MSHRTLAFPLFAAVLIVASTFAAPNDTPAALRALAAADEAWDRGDYVTALNDYIKLLNSADGDALLARIALQTGELYESRELTSDGRAPRFSPDGRYAAYEQGLEVSRATRILRNDAAWSTVAELAGVSSTFSPAGDQVAYLKIAPTPDVTAAAQALDQAPLAGQNRNGLIQSLTYQILRAAAITVRDLASGQEREIAASGLLKTGLAFSGDGKTLFFLGGREDDEARNDIYAVAADGSAAPVRLTDVDGFKSAPVVDRTGTWLLFTTANQNPFRKPQPPGGAQAPAQGAGRGGAGGGQGGGAPRPPSFALIEIASRKMTMIEGAAPALSTDGKSLAYIARAGAEYHLMAGPPAAAKAIKKTAERLDAPAFSPDGRRIAYQVMSRDDWEVHIANQDGAEETRLTRDVQHDLLPQFVGNDRLLSVVGEARHRRSFLIDIATRARQRLFHNNTVRTIAPEYQWIVSADGQQILIGAERDGDTVSPQRGVYVMDLRRTISKSDLLTRLRASLAAETSLRAFATKAYAPIAADVKKVVDAVSVSRIYGYEKALYDFDSKHITRPGNKLAADYLLNAYQSFGYDAQQQWFEQRTALGGKTANVLATLEGTVNPELVYVVSSHYDSVAAGPGADDDTSGTAALLEAARVLANHPMPATIIFASFTGEEAGLLGSREFVRQAVANKMQIVGALNNDMIGWTNDHRLDNTIRYSNPGIRDIQHGAAFLFTNLITYDALYFKSTDAAAYYDAYGDIVGGIGSYPVLSNPHYHQSHDLLEFENHPLIAETSKTTVATLMLLASSPSRLKDLKIEQFTGGAATLSWTPSPEKGVTSYVVASGPASAPLTRRTTVSGPRAKIAGLSAGDVISVKAVNAKGLEGWDWARVTVK